MVIVRSHFVVKFQLQCTEGMFSSRNGMKPCTTTPSG